MQVCDVWLARAVIAFKSMIQPTVGGSTLEAEYMNLNACANEVKFLLDTMEALGYPQIKPTPLFCDNATCLKLAEDPKFRDRSKFIDISYHNIREYIEDGVVVTE